MRPVSPAHQGRWWLPSTGGYLGGVVGGVVIVGEPCSVRILCRNFNILLWPNPWHLQSRPLLAIPGRLRPPRSVTRCRTLQSGIGVTLTAVFKDFIGQVLVLSRTHQICKIVIVGFLFVFDARTIVAIQFELPRSLVDLWLIDGSVFIIVQIFGQKLAVCNTFMNCTCSVREDQDSTCW